MARFDPFRAKNGDLTLSLPRGGGFHPPYYNFVHNFAVSEYNTIKFYDISNEPILHVFGKFDDNMYHIAIFMALYFVMGKAFR